MSATTAPARRPRAARRRSWWPGLVWAIPLAALIIVAYLGIQALAKRGELITVTFDRAAGASPGNTKVRYQGVDVGTLVDIVPNKDQKRLDFKLRMDPRSKPYLNSNARFWLIGASPTITDLSSLKAVVEGVAIGFAPGDGGKPARSFQGLDRQPVVLPGERGKRFVLDAHSLDTVQEGSSLLFRGLPIGKVAAVHYAGQAGFRLEVFVSQPYDSLIRPGDLFWNSSPVQLSFAGGSINATLAPASTIVAGGVNLEVPSAAAAREPSPAGAEFTLYPSQDAALQQLSGPSVDYDLEFGGAAGDLAAGAPVTLAGFRIGEVESVHLAFSPRDGAPFTAVTARIYLQRLGPPRDHPPAGDLRAEADARLLALLRLGYRARLQQTPALVGARSIALVQVSDAGPARLATEGDRPRIPSAPGATDFADITAQADQLLSKLNHLPLERIGRDLAQTTDRLRSLATSPELAAALGHLGATLAQLDQTLHQVQPEIKPLLEKLNQTADQLAGTAQAAHDLLSGQGEEQDQGLPQAIGQLGDAARSIRGLADYLQRHPEALLRGKRPDK